MSAVALIVRHKTKPGMRDEMRSIWERFVKPNALKNPDHLAYYFCYDTEDRDAVTAFQIFSNAQAKDAFLKSEWYPDYIREVSNCIIAAPHITVTTPIWSKL